MDSAIRSWIEDKGEGVEEIVTEWDFRLCRWVHIVMLAYPVFCCEAEVVPDAVYNDLSTITPEETSITYTSAPVASSDGTYEKSGLKGLRVG